MPFYCTTIDGYVSSISRSFGSNEITEDEFKALQSIMSECPTAPDGYGYKLRTDMTWEMYELPEQTEGDSTGYTEDELLAMTNAELERILATYGLTATANKSNMIRLILYMQQGGGTDA